MMPHAIQPGTKEYKKTATKCCGFFLFEFLFYLLVVPVVPVVLPIEEPVLPGFDVLVDDEPEVDELPDEP